MIKKLYFSESDKQFHIASCGTKVMQKIIFYKKGIEVSESDLMRMGNTSRKGTPMEKMLRIADNFNLNYSLKYNSSILDLIDSIDKGNPIILSIQSWPNKKVVDWSQAKAFGHYITAYGYDNREDKIFYYDPYDGKKKSIRYEKLHKMWHDEDFKNKIVYNHFGIFFEN